MIAFHGEKFQLRRIRQETGTPLAVFMEDKGPGVEFHNDGKWDLGDAAWLILAREDEFGRMDAALGSQPATNDIPVSANRVLGIYEFFLQFAYRTQIMGDNQDIHARAMDLTRAWIQFQGAENADALGNIRNGR